MKAAGLGNGGPHAVSDCPGRSEPPSTKGQCSWGFPALCRAVRCIRSGQAATYPLSPPSTLTLASLGWLPAATCWTLQLRPSPGWCPSHRRPPGTLPFSLDSWCTVTGRTSGCLLRTLLCRCPFPQSPSPAPQVGPLRWDHEFLHQRLQLRASLGGREVWEGPGLPPEPSA